MKVLIAIIACHKLKYRAYIRAQRNTWIGYIPKSVDYKFFYGKSDNEVPAKPDEVFLDCPDDYDSLPKKVQKIYQYAVENNYDYVFKVDCDSFVFVDRLLSSNFNQHDFVGRRNDCSNGYASGGPGFWLSKKAFEIIAKQSDFPDPADDRWVGQVLLDHGIVCFNDSRYILSYKNPNFEDIISICDIDGNKSLCYQMQNRVHIRENLADRLKI